PTLTYQWLRGEARGGGGEPSYALIAGATEAKYRVTEADQGYLLKCRVTATNEEGTAHSDSREALQTAGVAPHDLEAPQVIGTAEVNESLTCLHGAWSGAPKPALSVQWLRNGSPIGGASESSYTVTGEDRGASVSCRVTASNREGSSSASSKPVHVRGIKPEDIEAPRVSGGSSVGAEAKCVPGVWNGKPPPMFTYQWLRDGAVISSATSSVYRVELADEGHVLSCAVTATNGEGSAEAQSSNGLTIPRPAIAE